MTDLEIDKALALAIGWKDHDIDPDVITIRGAYDPEPEIHCWHGGNWHRFDYRDWNVIGPIAERYDCFPFQIRSKEEDFGKWNVVSRENDIMAASPQRAIALAVIGSVK